jgi:hypothetical protein
MTIIIATTSGIVSDSQTRWGDAVLATPFKIKQCGAALVGVAGDWGLADAWLAAYRPDTELPVLQASGDRTIDVLVVWQEALWWADQLSTVLSPLHEPVWAVGSGMFLALGALWAGASVLEAAAITCERGSGCGWPLQWRDVAGNGGCLRRESWLTNTSIHEKILDERPWPYRWGMTQNDSVRGEMLMAKTSFKRGTRAQKARGKVAEDLKHQGMSTEKAFAIATTITKKASAKGRKRLARRGLKS